MTSRNRLGLVPIGAYILLMPFYLAPPSYPQVADFVMLFLAIWMAMTRPMQMSKTFKTISILLLGFFGYSVLVNGYFALTLNDVSILKSSSFYVFNLLAFTCIYQHYRIYGGEFLRFVAMMVAVSVCFQGFVAFSGLRFGNRASRATIFFNNPNQLGYWSLLSMSLLALAVTKIKMPRLLMVTAFVAGTLITALALSKAAMIGTGFLFLLIGMRKPWLVVGALVMLVVFVNTPTGKSYVDRVQHRFATLGEQNDDSLEGRFYDRIFNNPQYWVLGSGEGGYDRYTEVEDHLKEIHSSFGSMFFCYGIIGSAMFFGAIMLIFNKSWTAWSYAIPLMGYSVSHNGLRFTSFWLFLAFVLCFYEWSKQLEAEKREQLAEPERADPIRDGAIVPA